MEKDLISLDSPLNTVSLYLMKSKYYGERMGDDKRAMQIMCKDLPHFYAVYVLNAPIPPTQFHVLRNGFDSLKALRKFCAQYGIALAPTCHGPKN